MSHEHGSAHEPGVVTKMSPLPVEAAVARLTETVRARGMKLFAVVDQGAEARAVGLELRETVLVLFGNPAAGTPVMAASPLSALDLPLKVVVWDDGGETRVSYYSPATIAARHGLSAELAKNLAGIDVLTDAIVSP
jgi:uncharacterized protein (DUF302 family)